MTRYILSASDFLKLILFSLSEMKGGEIFLPICSAMKIIDLAHIVKEFYVSRNFKEFKDPKIILGEQKSKNVHENIHERMVSDYEEPFVFSCGENYMKIDLKGKSVLGPCDLKVMRSSENALLGISDLRLLVWGYISEYF